MKANEFPRNARHWVLAITGACSMICSAATAGELSQSLDFHLTPAAQTGALVFAPFDSSLGTLTGVTLEFSATRRHDWGIWNAGTTARTVAYSGSLTNTLLSLSGSDYLFGNESYGPAVTSSLLPVSVGTFSSEFTTGYTAFNAGSTAVFPSAFQLPTAFLDLNGSQAMPLSFDGNLAIGYDGGDWNLLATNVYVVSLVGIDGSVTVKYDFAPRVGAVPELASMWYATGFVAVLVTVIRFRIRSRKSPKT